VTCDIPINPFSVRATFNVIPGERRTRDHPGCGPEMEIAERPYFQFVPEDDAHPMSSLPLALEPHRDAIARWLLACVHPQSIVWDQVADEYVTRDERDA